MIKLKEEQVRQLPQLLGEEGKTMAEVAEMFGCSRSTIDRWTRRYKKEGKPIKMRRGPKPIKI